MNNRPQLPLFVLCFLCNILQINSLFHFHFYRFMYIMFNVLFISYDLDLQDSPSITSGAIRSICLYPSYRGGGAADQGLAAVNNR